MTAQEAKQYLSRDYRIEERINVLIEQMERYKDMATRVSAVCGDGIHSGNNESKVENAVVKLVSLEQDLDKEIDHLVNVKRDVKRNIDYVKDPRQKMVLELRYLQYLRFPDIARRMNYSTRQVQNLHVDALQEVARILELRDPYAPYDPPERNR